jgi:uncharacterized damage-inducible protein DinB
VDETLIETWAIHNRIHLYLLQELPPEALGASLFPKGRTVYALFAHLHNVRLMWLQSAAPELLEGLQKLETKATGTQEDLNEALDASSKAIEALVRDSLAAGGRVKGFKPHVTAFVGYLISHESHHRGQIEWALRHAGHPLSDRISYGLWEWGVR